MAGKNLLLLERIASDLQWPDVHLHNDIRSGFKLTGNPQPSGVFDLDFKPAALEEHELGTKMQYFKHALWEKVAEQAEQDFTVPLWDITCEECQVKNWLVGPFTWDELETRYNKNWLPCRRFAVWQSNKWRPIDDLSENGVNAAYTVCEKISLRALDETIWCAMTLMRMSRDRGSFTFKLSDGSVLSAKVHDSWPGCGDHGKPHVKTVDLKSAYKQWAIAPTERCKTVVTLQDPSTGAAAGFECLTLPFGAISSVICFNRIARLYQRVLHEVLVLAANYYDDYPVIELGGLADSTECTLKAVASLLGFTVASDKELPFCRSADLLGVTLDLTDEGMSAVRVCNKETRVNDMAENLQQILWHYSSI